MWATIVCDMNQTAKILNPQSFYVEGENTYQLMGWSPKPQNQSPSKTINRTLDEIRLGSFKQRVITAFTAQKY